MTETSVLEIQVNDAQFLAFAKKLEDFRKASAGGGGDKKSPSEFADKFKKVVQDTIRPYQQLDSITKSIESNVSKATTNLLKWSGIASIVGLISGAGGFFGIDRLASAAALQRKSASGSGVSIGEQNAFRINQNRFLNNPDATLSRVNELQNDISQKYKLALILGHPTDGMSNLQIAEEANLKAHNAFQQAHGDFNQLKARGYGELYSNDELQRLGTRSAADIQAANDQTNKDVGKVGLNDKDADKWQEFLNILDRVGTAIQHNLIEALTPLAGPIGRVVTSFGELATALIKSPAFEHFVNFVADGFGKLADYIGTPKFEKDILDFVSGIDKAASSFAALVKSTMDLVGGFAGIAAFLNKYAFTSNDPHPDGQGDDPTKPNYDPARDTKLPGYSRFNDPSSFFYWNSNKGGAHTGINGGPNGGGSDTNDGALSGPGGIGLPSRIGSAGPGSAPNTNFSGITQSNKMQRAAAILARDGLPPHVINGILANIQAEGDFNERLPGDGGLAYGLGQWHPDRQKDFADAFHKDIRQSSFDEQVEFINYELHHKERNALNHLMGAANDYEGGAAGSVFYERPGAVTQAARNRGNAATTIGNNRDIQVIISNTTGGNAQTNINGLAQPS